MRFSTWDTSAFSVLHIFSGWSSSVEDEAERTHWEAARLIPDKSETEPEGTNDGGLERAISVPPKHQIYPLWIDIAQNRQ